MNFSLEIGPKTEVDTVPALSDVYITMLPGGDYKETLEASEAFGATTAQKLKSVQIPLALPTVFAGVNQTIMMALAMVVIASMIGVKGLGVPILRAVSNQYLALGMMNGLAIVALAIVFDRVTQEYGRRIQKHRGQIK